MSLSKQTSIKIADPYKMADWELILVCCHHAYQIMDMNAQEQKELYLQVYSKNDGYGSVGFVPYQGYDWSGIRDSSENAVMQMAKAARDYLQSKHIKTLNYRYTKI